MTNLFAKKHLRLVSKASRAEMEESRQVTQAFDSERQQLNCRNISLFLLREVEVLRENNFPNFLFEQEARVFFDVRVAPRLDFIAPNRSLAFRKFSELGIDYVDVAGVVDASNDLSKSSMPEHWADLVIGKINALEVKNFSAFFIFDNDHVLRRAHNVLPAEIGNYFKNELINIEVNAGGFFDRIAM